MKTIKTILNRRANQLSVDDQIIAPAWARGRIEATAVAAQTKLGPGVLVTYASGGPEPILYLSTYVVTVERMVPVAQFQAMEAVPQS